MTAPVFLADAQVLLGVEPGVQVRLDGDEGRHAARVRRLRVGEQLDLTDGAGLVVEASVSSVERDALVVTVARSRREPRPSLRITVVQGVPKGERGERAVEQLVEVGADRIVPWWAERCVTRWNDARAPKSLQRWRSTARESGKQARRWWAVDVTEPHNSDQVARLLSTAELAVVLHEEASVSLATVALPERGDVVLVVGPEGGITAGECASFEAAGAVVARLGPTVLRTSTAGTVAAGILLSRSGRW
ncbi:MAG: 16S rRNA (uracil(1498)-N(3))-methyltransferase [Actinomycetes bacterium]